MDITRPITLGGKILTLHLRAGDTSFDLRAQDDLGKDEVVVVVGYDEAAELSAALGAKLLSLRDPQADNDKTEIYAEDVKQQAATVTLFEVHNGTVTIQLDTRDSPEVATLTADETGLTELIVAIATAVSQL